MAQRPSAVDIITRLDLKPHPEGGHYRETFRDSSVDADGRSRSTAIYFLLARGERSHWHRIDATEVWHYHAGDALILRISDGAGTHSITASYGGATGFGVSTSAALTQTVKPATSATTTVSFSSSSVTIGKSDQLIAVVAPATSGGAVPTGTVTFTDDVGVLRAALDDLSAG